MKEYSIRYTTDDDEKVQKELDTYEECVKYMYKIVNKGVFVDSIQIYTSSCINDSDLKKELYLNYRLSCIAKINSRLKSYSILDAIDFKNITTMFKKTDNIKGITYDNEITMIREDDSECDMTLQELIDLACNRITNHYSGIEGATDESLADTFSKCVSLYTGAYSENRLIGIYDTANKTFYVRCYDENNLYKILL